MTLMDSIKLAAKEFNNGRDFLRITVSLTTYTVIESLPWLTVAPRTRLDQSDDDTTDCVGQLENVPVYIKVMKSNRLILGQNNGRDVLLEITDSECL